MPPPKEDHHRCALNNFLQHIKKQGVFKWEKDGPPQGPWYAIATIDGVEYGRAFHRNLGEAKEEAARIALAEYKKKYGGS